MVGYLGKEFGWGAFCPIDATVTAILTSPVLTIPARGWLGTSNVPRFLSQVCVVQTSCLPGDCQHSFDCTLSYPVLYFQIIQGCQSGTRCKRCVHPLRCCTRGEDQQTSIQVLSYLKKKRAWQFSKLPDYAGALLLSLEVYTDHNRHMRHCSDVQTFPSRRRMSYLRLHRDCQPLRNVLHAKAPQCSETNTCDVISPLQIGGATYTKPSSGVVGLYWRVWTTDVCLNF